MGAQPSRTAWEVAVRRAAHQAQDEPRVFEDPLALRITGGQWVRSRYAEDELARSVARRTRQYVVLGAGLDTFAYRNSHGGLRVFEIDHPATQEWKKQLLGRAEIPVFEGANFVPVDFEHDSLADCLRDAGFKPEATFFFMAGAI